MKAAPRGIASTSPKAMATDKQKQSLRGRRKHYFVVSSLQSFPLCMMWCNLRRIRQDRGVLVHCKPREGVVMPDVQLFDQSLRSTESSWVRGTASTILPYHSLHENNIILSYLVLQLASIRLK